MGAHGNTGCVLRRRTRSSSTPRHISPTAACRSANWTRRAITRHCAQLLRCTAQGRNQHTAPLLSHTTPPTGQLQCIPRCGPLWLVMCSPCSAALPASQSHAATICLICCEGLVLRGWHGSFHELWVLLVMCREPSFGHGILKLLSPTEATWSWYASPPEYPNALPLHGCFLAQTSCWRAQHAKESACVGPHIRNGSDTGQCMPKHAWREK